MYMCIYMFYIVLHDLIIVFKQLRVYKAYENSITLTMKDSVSRFANFVSLSVAAATADINNRFLTTLLYLSNTSNIAHCTHADDTSAYVQVTHFSLITAKFIFFNHFRNV